MFQIFRVMENERALLFRKGQFVRALKPGQHRVFDPFSRYSIEYFTHSGPGIEDRLARFLLESECSAMTASSAAIRVNA